jgi:isoquinoline 1-oxidoreductase
MSITRRQFLATLGGTGLVYALRFVPETHAQTTSFGGIPADDDDYGCRAEYIDIDYTEWIVFGPDDRVSVFTGRTELGQGLKTVITAIVTQGLEISQEQLTVVQGDTERCPDDGPTNGSAATRQVGMGFWTACQKIRKDLVKRASDSLGIPPKRLEYRSGGVGRIGKTVMMKRAFELGSGEAVRLDIDPTKTNGKQYVDLEIPNVNAEKIVTGQLKYVGDLQMPGLLYAGWLRQPYHPKLTRLISANMDSARALPGIKRVDEVHGRVVAIGERYSDVIKALNLVKAQWTTPERPKELRVEEEARAGAELEEVKENQGDIEAGLAASDLVISETYSTQYAAHAPIETDAAVATPMDAESKVTVWVSSQYPHKAREMSARYLKIPESNVHVIAMPVGGAFGGKIANPVSKEAASLATLVNAPVKLIYSRTDQFQLRSLFKAACIIDVTTGVSADGRMIARKIDCYQDVADGTTETYQIPNVLTSAYKAKWPFGRASSRGTSFVQTCFATESHVDMVAHGLGMDPLEFRRKNVRYPAYINLIDACAEMIGYGSHPLNTDEGIGMAIVNHGGAQLGAIAAKVAVDRDSGKVKLIHICVAIDVGPIINRRTATVGIRGGVAWGIGYALSEEIMLNGHSTQTEFLSQYKIPRFSDMPPIDIRFFDNHHPGSVRGCGEMPVIPTIGAIVNAVYNAVGVRFYSTPLTPEQVKEALG